MNVVHSTKHLDTARRIYRCSTCDNLFNWSDGSAWYGSLKQLENEPSKIKYYCSEKCKPTKP